MAKHKHADYRASAVISLFLGHFVSEAKLDRYLGAGFRKDFAFAIDPKAGPECSCSKKPKDIRTLLQGFSWQGAFADAAAASARKLGWNEAECAVVFYNFKYEAEPGPVPADAALTFIGVFPFGEPE